MATAGHTVRSDGRECSGGDGAGVGLLTLLLKMALLAFGRLADRCPLSDKEARRRSANSTTQ